MARILFLAHRIPYPPDKGDKIRSWHLLKFLAERHEVHLGCFIDEPLDRQHMPILEALCARTCFLDLAPRAARLRALTGLVRGQALTLPYYWDPRLAAWIDDTLATASFDALFAFSSSMAQYIVGPERACSRRVADFVDLDSAKWAAYADRTRGPMRWLYRREARRLLAFERQVAGSVDLTLLVTPEEARDFCALAPGAARRVASLGNGVDAAYFDPAGVPQRAFADAPALVFTGAMDYWPNIDGVDWFARNAFPALRRAFPHLSFYIVGAKPAPRVRDLSKMPGIRVTGAVPDVRPYLAAADVVVCPLRVARGIQNKVLEAMAMARPVVATRDALCGIGAAAGDDILAATSADEFVSVISSLLKTGRGAAIGRRARQRVLNDFTWARALRAFEGLLLPETVEPSRGRGVV